MTPTVSLHCLFWMSVSNLTFAACCRYCKSARYLRVLGLRHPTSTRDLTHPHTCPSPRHDHSLMPHLFVGIGTSYHTSLPSDGRHDTTFLSEIRATQSIPSLLSFSTSPITSLFIFSFHPSIHLSIHPILFPRPLLSTNTAGLIRFDSLYTRLVPIQTVILCMSRYLPSRLFPLDN